MTAPIALRWGICSTGWISNKFSLDLLIDPTTRGAGDIAHRIVAVGASKLEKATAFVDATFAEAGAAGKEAVKTYGSYAELYADPDVDVIYIGTPHSHHYKCAHDALSAGKAVLCEKSVTVNAAQAKALVALARAKNLFFMEAVWLRFQPVSYKVQEILASGVIGQVRSVAADLSIDFQPDTKDASHRMISPALAGGALLDLGPYPWTWLAMLLLPKSSASNSSIPVPPTVGSMTKLVPSGVDASTVAVIQFPQEDGRILHGTLTTALDAQTTPGRAVLVQGSKGFLEVHRDTYRPESFSYSAWASADDYGSAPSTPLKTESFDFSTRPANAWGLCWEADEVARQMRDGKLESDRMPLRETVLMMEVFDKIRLDASLVYPESIETLDL